MFRSMKKRTPLLLTCAFLFAPFKSALAQDIPE